MFDEETNMRCPGLQLAHSENPARPRARPRDSAGPEAGVWLQDTATGQFPSCQRQRPTPPPEPATWAGSPWLRRRCPLAPASESCTELGSNGCVGPSVWRVSNSRMHAREPPSSHAGGYTAAWVPRPRPRLVSQREARPPSTTDAARGRELPPANSTS